MTDAANMPTVEYPINLRGVTRTFGKTVAVDDLTLQIPRGTTLGFIGLNGAGKTTAIRMAVGLLQSTAGAIAIEGHLVPAERDAIKSLIGYVPDRPHVYPWMRVRDAIGFVRSFYPRWNQQRCDEMLKIFELPPDRRAKHLSKGQAAKLSLLLAICHEPSVLILDEPTSGLDPVAREEFLEGVLAATADRGQTVLFSSHALADVQRLADSVALLHRGKLLLHQSVDGLLDSTKRIRAVLDDPAVSRQTPPGLVFEHLIGREWTITIRDYSPDRLAFVKEKNPVSHLEVQDMSLDDVFKDVVRGQKEVA